MNSIEDKIKRDVQDSIKRNQEDRINPKVLKKELFEFAPELLPKMRTSILLACIGESMGFISYFFAAYAAGALISAKVDKQQLFFFGFLAILTIMLQKILTALSSQKSHYISFTILKNIREHISHKLENMPLGYITNTPIGHYKALIVERVGSLEDWVAHVMPEMPSRMLHPLLGTIILFFTDWRLGLSMFFSLPLLAFAVFLMMYKREEKMYTWLNSNYDLNSRVIEYVNGINVIKAFGQENKSYDKFVESVDFYHSSTLNWWKQSWVSMAILFAILNTPLIGTLPMGIYLYSQGELEAWGLILGCILPMAIIPNSFEIIMSFQLYSMIETTWRMIREVIEIPDLTRPQTHCDLSDEMYEFKDVCFEYETDVEVLHKISFKVPKNSVFAIVGESGSGKSTIAKLMVSYFDVKSGEILFGGRNIQEIPIDQLMKNVSYVAQDNFLFDTTLRENMKIAKHDATDEEIKRALHLANCDELIARLPKGIDTPAGDCGKLLSGGERQRLTLARAMLCDAKCVVLDEATAYADPENEAKIQNAISTLVKDKTLIVVAHRLHTVVEADAILVIDQGKIVAQDTHSELLKNCDHYKRLWKHYIGTKEGDGI